MALEQQIRGLKHETIQKLVTKCDHQRVRNQLALRCYVDYYEIKRGSLRYYADHYMRYYADHYEILRGSL